VPPSTLIPPQHNNLSFCAVAPHPRHPRRPSELGGQAQMGSTESRALGMAAMRLSIDIIIDGDAVAARITARRLGSIPGR
jgi:hypothetical protein